MLTASYLILATSAKRCSFLGKSDLKHHICSFFCKRILNSSRICKKSMCKRPITKDLVHDCPTPLKRFQFHSSANLAWRVSRQPSLPVSPAGRRRRNPATPATRWCAGSTSSPTASAATCKHWSGRCTGCAIPWSACDSLCKRCLPSAFISIWPHSCAGKVTFRAPCVWRSLRLL